MQTFELLFDSLTIILGLIVAGESIALIIGYSLSGFEGQAWRTTLNILFVISDIILGVAIIFLVMVKEELSNYPLVFTIFLMGIIVTHLFREIQFLLDIIDKFLANRPLFIVNSLKIILAVILIIAEYLMLQTG